jgi:CubicO group peptidase (beta-lactamase class C family)
VQPLSQAGVAPEGWLTQALAAFDAPHAALAVVGPEGTRAAVGDVTHPFPLASVTKLLTTYAVLVALEEQTLSLGDAAGPPGSTVEHLLAHASGLGPTESFPVVAPGTRRIYSNFGFETLAGHLAAVAGIAFGDYLRDAVLGALAMTSTSLDGSPAYGAVATLGDLVSFAGELLSPRLIAAPTFARATTVAFPGLSGVLPGFGRQDPCDWGLGFELRDHKSPHWTGATNSPESFGHFGQSGTFLLVDPLAGVAVVVLSDRPFDDWAAQQWPPLLDGILADDRLAHGE